MHIATRVCDVQEVGAVLESLAKLVQRRGLERANEILIRWAT